MKSDLVELCNFRGKQFKLLYRASRDGFQAKRFHSKCDNQPRTLTVIRASKFIFGGYTAAAWDTSYASKTDPDAFIFSLVNYYHKPTVFPVKAGGLNAIDCDPEHGPTFGRYNDFDLCIGENKKELSSTHLGQRYNFDVFSDRSFEKEPVYFLAGSFFFTPSEIEVFSLD